MLRLHDTALGHVTDFVPREPGKVTLYVCGPTVYGAPHVGHGRFALVYDVLRRYLEYVGNDVRHVSNVTDIDDKIIDRANREHREWRDVAEECETQWWSAMDAMGVLRPTVVPHATDYLEEMVGLIDELVRADHAYETSDGVYLSVSDVPDYGLLKHQNLDSLLAGARVDVIEEKRSPGDFAVWKKVKPGEPSWPSPFGERRPGWHTECVVMSLALLGEGFDLHGGGQDLIFPHHENERAQAVANGKRFSQYWVHNGFVTVGGEKMSKSLDNFTNLEDLLASTDPRAYRLLVLRSHYRSPLEVTSETLADAATTLTRIDTFARRIDEARSALRGGLTAIDVALVKNEFIAAMDNDLDTPGALAGLFGALRRANGLLDSGDTPAAVATGEVVLELLGALGITAAHSSKDGEEVARELADRRDAAREARDFALADQLRSEIETLGWKIEDTPSGARLYR